MKLIVASAILLLDTIHPITAKESYLLDVDSVTRLSNNRVNFVYHHRVNENFTIIRGTTNCQSKKFWTIEKRERGGKHTIALLADNEAKVNLVKKVCYYAGY